ncbi:MAG: cytochrome c oxidase accessory protein CcoG [Gammaproteobacteria bacterium]|nr:cytochrome c oxidase accessory protein CcoG [Gammaproteobacteria bacterium]MDH5650261.1 cytochrome c oxidase accessory protein CcoG [Gammaproteobacteria bacterium]
MKTSSKQPAEGGGEFYEKHKKVYPREVHGLFATLRVTGVLTLLGLYYLLPWLSWEGHQAVLFDLPARKFYIFTLTFWPQDFIYLAALLIISALALFFFTTLAGRLWCGYACPQTVWTEVFLWMERWFEGDRNKQIKLDNAPMAGGKFLRKSAKHTVWLLFSLWTGFTFVGYFTPITELGQAVLQFNTGPWETFWILFYGFATYGNAGWMREQVCIYMCPYARFQSAMFDKDTLLISYDEQRGEPRGSRKRSADPKNLGLGDCVDCTLCVQVCPTGIDIRDGLQYQCIGCAACVDVCNDVMGKMKYAPGLIRYTTENAMQGVPTRILRPRVTIYITLLCAITAALIYSMLIRLPLGLDVIRDRNALYRETNEGLIENIYILKIINMDKQAHEYHLTVSGLEGATLLLEKTDLLIDAGKVVTVPARIRIDPVHLKKIGYDVYFTLTAKDNSALHVRQKGRFIGPLNR